ncbi:MAG TPA: type II secretion system protein [Candidatus Saccharimonadales bacterium]|nr:type II secretion system protein [Candidatus Saccharimonadales bacterium]
MATSAGFTLIELLMVMALLVAILGLTMVNIIRPQTRASLTSTLHAVLADLKGQQLKAMVGDSGNAAAAQAHGVFLESGQYTLFKGNTYPAGDSENFVAPAQGGATISTTFPSAQIVFNKGTGEVACFVAATCSAGTNTITLTSASETKVITLNRYGAIAVN